jgi:coatomer protein complex subunit epsilon
METPDHLFPVRNAFYLGNYQAAVNAVMSGVQTDNDAQSIERDVLLYRSYIALGNYGLVLAEIKHNAPTALQAVKLLATYKSDPVRPGCILPSPRFVRRIGVTSVSVRSRGRTGRRW